MQFSAHLPLFLTLSWIFLLITKIPFIISVKFPTNCMHLSSFYVTIYLWMNDIEKTYFNQIIHIITQWTMQPTRQHASRRRLRKRFKNWIIHTWISNPTSWNSIEYSIQPNPRAEYPTSPKTSPSLHRTDNSKDHQTDTKPNQRSVIPSRAQSNFTITREERKEIQMLHLNSHVKYVNWRFKLEISKKSRREQ